METGKDVRRKNGHALEARMANTMEDLMVGWTKDNFYAFEETMEMIKEGAPVQWVKLYLEAVKMGLTKNTNININISRQQDREHLQALVGARVRKWIPDNGEYVPYVEMKSEALPSRREDETIQ